MYSFGHQEGNWSYNIMRDNHKYGSVHSLLYVLPGSIGIPQYVMEKSFRSVVRLATSSLENPYPLSSRTYCLPVDSKEVPRMTENVNAYRC